MGTLKKIFFVVLLFCITQLTVAQQDAQYTQYMYNTMAVNPAYAGVRGHLSIVGLYRAQWLGLDGAPVTQTLNINTPLSDRVGVGFSLVNDEIGNGTNRDTYFDGVFSYNVKTSDEGKLAFGLKAGGHLLKLDFTKLQLYTNEAQTLGLESSVSKFTPNFGAGVYYYTNKFYVGLSVPNFLETKHYDDDNVNHTYLASERVTGYFISGYVFDLKRRDVKLKPTFLLKAVNGAPLQADFSLNAIFNEKFTFGVAYRWGAAYSLLTAFQINESIMIGLAYDKETTALGNTQFNNGSYEFMIRYDILTRWEKCSCHF